MYLGQGYQDVLVRQLGWMSEQEDVQGNLDNDDAMDKDEDTGNGAIQDKVELFVGVGAGGCLGWGWWW